MIASHGVTHIIHSRFQVKKRRKGYQVYTTAHGKDEKDQTRKRKDQSSDNDKKEGKRKRVDEKVDSHKKEGEAVDDEIPFLFKKKAQ